MDFFFVNVGSDAAHGQRDVLSDAEPCLPLVYLYQNHFSARANATSAVRSIAIMESRACMVMRLRLLVLCLSRLS